MLTKPAGQPVDFFFDTKNGDVLTAPVGGALAVYKDNSVTESTAGITFTVSFDGVVGTNQVHIDTTADATFYANGSSFIVKLTAGTVAGVSVVGRTVGEFQLTAAADATGFLDLANGIETGLTPRQALRLMVAALAGKLSGAATTTVTIRNAVADSKNRIVATVTADGNRTAVTTDLT